jgi:hypothetical protein
MEQTYTLILAARTEHATRKLVNDKARELGWIV